MNTIFHPTAIDDQTGAFNTETVDAFPRLPDTVVCRSKLITPRLVECTAQGAEDCPFVVAFGRGFFCWHPQRFEIAMRNPADRLKEA
jgi:hypothetical protein